MEKGDIGGRVNRRTDRRTDKQDVSKNDQGWLVSDLRWISGILELGLTDRQKDGQTLL